MTNSVNTVFYRRIEIAKNVIAELTNYLIIIAVSYVFQNNFTEDKADKAVYFFLVTIPLFYYFLREKCKMFSVFLLFHLLPIVVTVLVCHASPGQKVFVILIEAACLAVSFIRRFNKKNGAGMEVLMPSIAMAAFIILYLVDAWQGKGICGSFMRQLTVFFVFGYFIFYFLKQFLHYMDMNDRTTDNIPVQHIFYSAAGLSGVFTVISALIIALTSDWALIGRMGQIIRNIFFRLLTFIFSLFPEGQEPVVESASEEEMEEILWGAEQLSQEGAFVKAMDKLISIFAAVLICVLLAAAVIGVVKLIRAAFARKQKEHLISEENFTDQVEDIKPAEERKEKKGRSLLERIRESLSPEEKIRRLYRKTMLSQVTSWKGEKKAAILKKATARECCMQFFPMAPQEAQDLAGLYEKARYSKGLCGQEDVRRAKLLAQRLSQEG